MTTLAGRKIREFREAQATRMTRAQFARECCGRPHKPPSYGTVQGWEEEGKVPDDPRVVNAIARAGVATHADWFRPAQCARCERRSDSPEADTCSDVGCPLAHLRDEAA